MDKCVCGFVTAEVPGSYHGVRVPEVPQDLRSGTLAVGTHKEATSR